MILAGILIIFFSILLIRNARKQQEKLVWQRCSSQTISLAYQAQACFSIYGCQFVYVCYSDDENTFWVEKEPTYEDTTWSIKVSRRDTFEKLCLEIEGFVSAAPYCNE